MDDHYKICGNCGHVTMVGGEFVCINPQKPGQEVVQKGERRPCFVVTALTPEQFEAATLAPDLSASIN